MIKRINQFYAPPDSPERSILNTKSEEVKDINKEILQFYCDLEDTFNNYIDKALGLASNQIWENSFDAPPAMFVFKIGKDDIYTIAINPKIKGTGSKIKGFESCLSFPETRTTAKKRDKNVTIEYMDIDGNFHKEKHTLLVARTIFHEYDHLQGKVI